MERDADKYKGIHSSMHKTPHAIHWLLIMSVFDRPVVLVCVSMYQWCTSCLCGLNCGWCDKVSGYEILVHNYICIIKLVDLMHNICYSQHM